jgi:hypothetical protein
MTPDFYGVRAMIGTGIGIGVGMAAVVMLAAAVRADTGTGAVGIVSNINVVSDKVLDVSSVEAWAKSYIKPGMTDREKAIAVWKSVVAHQHQNSPPVEYLHSPENAMYDPIKMFNVYGYGLCSVHACHMAAMARAAGLVARNQSIQRHCVAEVFFEGEWHMLDASLVNYFPKPDGKIASVDEIIAATGQIYKQHPELKENPEALDKFRKEGKWKEAGGLLASCPFYNGEGLLAANWPWQCGWMETMREYDGTRQFIYEPGYSMGYRVNVQLREGERLTRNWFNKGMHINMEDPKDSPTCLNMKVGEGSMSYLKDFGDIAPGRIGNGVHEYDVPLASGVFRGGALVAENLAAKSEDGKGPAVHVKDASKPGVLVIREASSYVYLGGSLRMDAVTGGGGKIVVSFSENNGLDWREVRTIEKGEVNSIDLKPLIFRRYDYQLKFEMTGAGTGLELLKFREDIQHSQAPLPALAQGDNTITFSAGNEGTITVEGSTQKENKGKQVLASDFHLKSENITDPMLSVDGKSGWVEFPVATPAAMKRLRVFSFYRARGEQDHWDVTASFDGGKTYRDLGVMEGSNKAMEKKFVVNDVPAGVKEALVRFTGTQKDGALLFNVRIDADYQEPKGGFRPIKVTYVWEENGAEKRDVHVAKTADDTWRINCAGKPLMKSYVVEMAD